MFVAWWLDVVAIMIVSSYTLVLYCLGVVKIDQFIMFIVYATILCVIIYLAVSEQMNAVSEDILSFLFKYPISKLTAEEAAQVELLIVTLSLHKPVLKASDIFVVGTRLLASV
ncbi:hypothetical protein FQR65_LT16231 [Abscondita terminalis]|nr:hypothetical protein FQR65_LT16231 [Abscondita terminalis]